MSEDESKTERGLSRFGDISKKGLEKAKESIIQSTQAVKLRLDITALRKEKKRLFAELGEEVYGAVKAGKLRTRLFKEDMANIDDLSAKIEEKEKELTELTGGSEEKRTEREEKPPAGEEGKEK